MPSTYTLIKGETLVSSAASYTFTAIPSTYTDLVVRASVRNDTVNDNIAMRMTVNGNTSSIYSATSLYADGSNVTSYRTSNTAFVTDGIRQNGSTSTSNTFTNLEIYIPSYLAAQNKPISNYSASETNAPDGSINVFVAAILARDTNPVTSIAFSSASTFQFVSGSSFYLYGIKSS
jgi:hypothetical protein